MGVEEGAAAQPNPDLNPGEKSPSMDSLTSQEEFPEPKENAIQAVQNNKPENPPAKPPKIKKDGTPEAKRGRKPGQKTGTGAASVLNTGEAPQPTPQQISSIYAATVTSGIFERASIAIISDEFTLTEAERAANIKAWADTFDYYGGVKLSPPQALMLDYAGILMSRAAKPKTQSKLKTLKEKFGSWLATRKINALFNRGKNAVGEDDIREEKSGESEKTR